jgi:EAL and modified HD-GYP domain-containing signal transduction protein
MFKGILLKNKNKDVSLPITTEDSVVDSEAKVFIGRQPIFDRNLNVVAYEILFRSGNTSSSGQFDGAFATAKVINNLLMEIGLEELTGGLPAYINFTKELILDGVVELLPPDHVVIEILEDIEVDDELINVVRNLREKKYTIALDDFTYSDEWVPLIELASIIKYDVMQHSLEEINKQREESQCKNKLLAEKVETQDEFNLYLEAGFEYFQGYFFEKPTVISQKSLGDSSAQLLQLLSALNNPYIEINEVELLVGQNLSFSYKLFKYLNSAAFAVENEITSIKQAIVYFGLDRLKKWTSLLVLSIAKQDNKPGELINIALSRAKMCELLAEKNNDDNSDTFFTVGLFSILDVIFGKPLETILSELPLDDSIKQALTSYKGKQGDALVCCLACEKQTWGDIKYSEVSIETIQRIYLDSMVWSKTMMSELDNF